MELINQHLIKPESVFKQSSSISQDQQIIRINISQKSKQISKNTKLVLLDQSKNTGLTQIDSENFLNKRKKRQKYQLINNEIRSKLIYYITELKMKIKKAAKELNLNYSTAKSIYQIYKNEGRIHKKLPNSQETDLSPKNFQQQQQDIIEEELNQFYKSNSTLTPAQEQFSTSDESQEIQSQSSQKFKHQTQFCTLVDYNNGSNHFPDKSVNHQNILETLRFIKQIQKQQLQILSLLEGKDYSHEFLQI